MKVSIASGALLLFWSWSLLCLTLFTCQSSPYQAGILHLHCANLFFSLNLSPLPWTWHCGCDCPNRKNVATCQLIVLVCCAGRTQASKCSRKASLASSLPLLQPLHQQLRPLLQLLPVNCFTRQGGCLRPKLLKEDMLFRAPSWLSSCAAS